MMMQVKFCTGSEMVKLSDGSNSTVGALMLNSSYTFIAEQTCNQTVPPSRPVDFANR